MELDQAALSSNRGQGVNPWNGSRAAPTANHADRNRTELAPDGRVAFQAKPHQPPDDDHQQVNHDSLFPVRRMVLAA